MGAVAGIGPGDFVSRMTTLTLVIEGMSCGHCLNAVNRGLAGLEGVQLKAVTIGRAELAYDPARINPDRIVAAVSEAGYRATPV